MTDSSPMDETKKSPGRGIWLSWPTKSQARAKTLLELLPVDLVADEDLAADDAPVDVDQGSEASEIRVEHGHALPCRRLRRRADHSATRTHAARATAPARGPGVS